MQAIDEVEGMALTSEIQVTTVQQMGGDATVVAAAKASVSGEAALDFAKPEYKDGNRGLIRFLMKQRHGTPFEHSAITFFVHAPIFVWREWHRHRIGFSYNEESGRYKKLEPVFWVPRRNRPMCPVDGWKPGRPKFLTLDDRYEREYAKEFGADRVIEHTAKTEADDCYEQLLAGKRQAYAVCYNEYSREIADGIAFEVARSTLPVAIYSSCWVTCNPRSLMAFLSLRTHDELANHVSYPQAEIEEAARACELVLEAGWPLTYNAWMEFGREAP